MCTHFKFGTPLCKFVLITYNLYASLILFEPSRERAHNKMCQFDTETNTVAIICSLKKILLVLFISFKSDPYILKAENGKKQFRVAIHQDFVLMTSYLSA